MPETRARFPYFWEVQAPDGAEGWERMYPAYLLSHEENRAEEEAAFWVQNAMHHPRAVFPFDTIVVEGISLSAGQNNSRVFAVPGAMGMRERISNGYRYLSPIEITDPDEIARRTAAFQERAGYYYANWAELSEKWKVKAQANVADTAGIDVGGLPELEDTEVVTSGRGTSSGYELLAAYNRLISNFFLMWQYHFEMANIAHAAFGAFTRFCIATFPGTTAQTLARMVAGQELLLYRPDDELKRLAARAIELGIEDEVREAAVKDDPLGAIGETEAGRTWLADLDAVKDPWFFYADNGNLYHDSPTWIDDLSIPIGAIKGYIGQLERGEDIARPSARLRAEAAELVEQHRRGLSADELVKFEQLLGVATKVLPFTQDHSFYGEHWFLTIFWQKMRQLGATLAERGLFAEADDVFYLHRHELSSALMDATLAWAIGDEPVEAARWRDEVRRRREIIAVLQASRPEPALGVPPPVITNPLLISHVGVTTAVVERWLNPGDIEPGDLSGSGASTGTAEGPCRVVLTPDDLDAVETGEILVCQTTTPAWGPVFSRLGGLISDTGGMMSHSAVVAREYGLPAVVGCAGGTRTLRTGDVVRLDGDQGTVTVLSPTETAGVA